MLTDNDDDDDDKNDNNGDDEIWTYNSCYIHIQNQKQNIYQILFISNQFPSTILDWVETYTQKLIIK